MPNSRNSSLSLANRFARLAWGIVYRLLFRPSPRNFHWWRNLLLRMFGADLHPTSRVYPRARCWAPWNLHMHENACVGDDVDLYCVASITIGANATVSQYSYLCGATHDYEDVQHALVPKPITIERRCWIAADVFIGPGVTIGEGTVVGARSSVFRDLPPWVIASGTPAKPIRDRKLGPNDFQDPPDESTVNERSVQ